MRSRTLRQAEEIGADGALLVAPYYNKPSQEGLFRHFAAIAEATSLKLVLYNIPGRCAVDIAADTVVRLAEDYPNIVSIKEASGSVDRVSELVHRAPDGFTVLSGDDSLTLPFLSVGAVGVVSVASNLFPAEVAQLVSLFLDGNAAEARRIHQKFFALFKDLFIEPNPVPAKTVLAWRGAMSAECPTAARRHEPGERNAAAQDLGRVGARAAMNDVPRVLLVGARGRMGRVIVAVAAQESGLTIAAELDQGDPIAPAIDGCDVVIDFSAAEATDARLPRPARNTRRRSFSARPDTAPRKRNRSLAAARTVPIVFAANFSVGVNTLFALTRSAAELLGEEFDLDVIEMHHRMKKDAPSGTAKRLLEILSEVRGGDGRGSVAVDSRRRHRGRTHRHLRWPGGAPRTDASRGQPGNVCRWRLARRALGHRPSRPGSTAWKMSSGCSGGAVALGMGIALGRTLAACDRRFLRMHP